MAKKIVLDENTKILVITISIALVTLILSCAIYNSHTSKIRELRSKINGEEQKLVIGRTVAKLDNIIKDYRTYFYKDITTDILRGTISALARDAGVDIVSMQPPVSVKFGNYTKISFKIKLNCTYNQLGKFIEKVERLSGFTKINQITIGGSKRYRTSSPVKILPDEEVRMSPSLTISVYCVES